MVSSGVEAKLEAASHSLQVYLFLLIYLLPSRNPSWLLFSRESSVTSFAWRLFFRITTNNTLLRQTHPYIRTHAYIHTHKHIQREREREHTAIHHAHMWHDDNLSSTPASRRSPVLARKGMVASSQPFASQTGLKLLQKGTRFIHVLVCF